MHRRKLLILLSLAAGGGLAACGGGGAGGGSEDVLAVARDAGLGQFLRAVRAAGLAETLSASGPYTVFAPSDAAFRALPRGRLDGLMRSDDREALRGLLAYHVVPGTFDAAFLEARQANYATLAGPSLQVDGAGGLRVNGARAIRPDLEASNGIVHVIDAVIAPG
jgi:uncharacterized surface protein with fasciclin (FAS1) repeats